MFSDKVRKELEQQYAFFTGKEGDEGDKDKEPDEPYELVPMEPRKLKPRGTYQVMQEYVGSDYPEFLLKVAAIGLTIRDRSAAEMKRGMLEYLKLCQQYNKPITNQAIYTAMGLTYYNAVDILRGRSGGKEQRAIVTYAKQLCAMHREALGTTGAINPILTIFWQKAYDGLREDAETGVGDSDDITRESAETIAEKYAELPD